MYNESCDLMDRREGQDVPVFIKLSELSAEGVGQKAHLELLSVSSYNLEVVSFLDISSASTTHNFRDLKSTKRTTTI